MKNITGEGEAIVSEWDVLRMMKGQNLMWTSEKLGLRLKISAINIRPLLTVLLARGEIFKCTHGENSRHKYFRHINYQEEIQPITQVVKVFKPLVCHLRKALEEKREGSRLNTQWKSKQI